MKKVFVAFVLLVLCASSRVQAEGALAMAIAEGGPKNGVAYTLNVRNDSREDAMNRAMEGCRKQAQTYNVPPSRCRVVASFRGKCVSVAFDTQERTMGWDLGNSQQDAIANAVRLCASSGAKNCKPNNTDCDR